MEINKRNKINSIRLIKQLELATNSTTKNNNNIIKTTTNNNNNSLQSVTAGEEGLNYFELLKLLAVSTISLIQLYN